MDLDRLTRWLGRRSEVPPDLAAALDDLARLAASHPELAASARSLGRILSAAFLIRDGAPVPVSPTDPFPRDGIPLFRRNPPHLDLTVVTSRAIAIAEAVRENTPAARSYRDALRRGRIDVAAWTRETLAGQPETIADDAGSLGIDPALAVSTFRLALLPSLARWTGPPAAVPSGACCPWCGGAPLLGELRGLEREVRLRCGLCAGDWPGGRLECAWCGESDHRRLSIRHAEEEADRRRVLACETCGGRLKLVATLARLSPPSLIVADLATIHLDFIAFEDSPAISSVPSVGS